MVHRTSWLAVLVAAALATLPTAGIAQEEGSTDQRPNRSELSTDQKRRLKRLIQEARSAYESEDFERSVEKLREAYELYPNPAFFYRIGLAEAHAGDTGAAIDSFERYLAAKPDSPKRQEVERRLASLRETRAGKRDDRSADAETAERQQSGEAEADNDGEPSKADAGPPASESTGSDEDGGSPTFGYVLGGVGAAAALSAGTFAYLFLQSEERLDAFRASNRRTPANEARERELIDERNRRLIVTYASGGLAVAALGSAAFLLLRNGGSKESRAASPHGTSSGFSVGLHPRNDGISLRIATPF